MDDEVIETYVFVNIRGTNHLVVITRAGGTIWSWTVAGVRHV